jgi:hypothetical protein
MTDGRFASRQTRREREGETTRTAWLRGLDERTPEAAQIFSARRRVRSFSNSRSSDGGCAGPHVDGHDELARRGHPARLVPTEWAHDTDEFFRRLAESEQLYYARRGAQVDGGVRAIAIETSSTSLGAPRSNAWGIALARSERSMNDDRVGVHIVILENGEVRGAPTDAAAWRTLLSTRPIEPPIDGSTWIRALRRAAAGRPVEEISWIASDPSAIQRWPGIPSLSPWRPHETGWIVSSRSIAVHTRAVNGAWRRSTKIFVPIVSPGAPERALVEREERVDGRR